MTRFLNNVFYAAVTVLTVIAAIPEDWVGIVPAKYKGPAVAALAAAAWFKAHRNLFINPDGTPAVSAWQAPEAGGK